MLRSQRLDRIAKAGQPVIYQYDELPPKFRAQVIAIWNDFFDGSDFLYTLLIKAYKDDAGIYRFTNEGVLDINVAFELYFQKAENREVLDVIEYTFSFISHPKRSKAAATKAIDKLNRRFAESDLGYKFVDGEILQVKSEYIHSEAVEPALHLLQDAGFAGPEQEFLSAHRHLRHGRSKEAATDALKAFGSTIKAICNARGWALPSPANASNLINAVFTNGLIPRTMEGEFNGLKMVLTGLPTVRNTTSAHGQGADAVELPEYVAAYALHMAAANIVFLVEAHKNNPVGT